jgi:hypothetical protein
MDDLRPQLERLREVLKSFWARWAEEKGRPEAATGATMCRFTSGFLSEVLGWNWRVQGGDPNHYGEDAGFFDGTTWQGHYWVSDGQRIVDLTANQFGAEEIVITSVDDPRYRVNYTPAELADALYEVEDRVEDWLDEYYAVNPPVTP